MIIRLEPINDSNRDAVLALSVREDQPFVATNEVSLWQADEANAEQPGVARPFAIYADEKLVGFCMFVFNPEEEDEDDRYWLWRFMIDKSEQGKGYGQAALQEIIKYFKKNGADRLFLSTEPENELGLHIYHKAGFRETGIIDGDEAVLMRMLKGPNRIIRMSTASMWIRPCASRARRATASALPSKAETAISSPTAPAADAMARTSR